MAWLGKLSSTLLGVALKLSTIREKSAKFTRDPGRYLTLFRLNRARLLTQRLAPYSWLDDKLWLEYTYYLNFGERLDLRNPKTFNENINWMKLYDRNPIYTQLADKLAMRDYVTERIGAQYLNELYGVYQRPEEIPWETLPEKFVVKVTHGSGWNIICQDKKNLDVADASARLNDWLKINYYTVFREWQYKNMRPKIIVEKFIEGDPSLDLVDYRLFCTEGAPKLVQVELNTYTHHTRAFFDAHWNRLPFSYNYPISTRQVEQPENYAEMLALASRLTQGLHFCRVDFYSSPGKLIVGELTFTPIAGYARFDPPEYNLILGDLFKLPAKGTR